MSEPKELWIAYYNECSRIIPKRFSFTEDERPERDKLFKYMNNIWLNTVDIPEPDFSKYAREEFEKDVKKYDQEIKDTLSSYIEISEASLEEVDNAFGKIDFLLGNKGFKNQIYKSIQLPLHEYKSDINEKSFRFRSYFETQNGNTAVMIDMIDEIQQKYYMCADESNENYQIFTIYQQWHIVK